jgi:uroporphyrinogen decarboxylase
MIDLKEEMVKAIKLEPLERVPTSFFAGGVWSIYNSGNTFEELGMNADKYAEMLIATQEKLQNNVVFTSSGFNNFVPISLGGELKKRSPFLNLAPDLKAPIVKTIEDVDKLDSSRLEESKYIQNIRAGTRKVVQAIGDKVMVSTTNWGPFTMAGQMRGVGEMLMDVNLNPELVDRLLARTTEIILDFYRPYADIGIDMATLSEPTGSGDMISPSQFDKLVMPHVTRLVSSLKGMGIPYTMVHICGWTEDRIERMAGTGADIFSLDHRVDISKARAGLRGKMCFAGNVDPVKVMKDGRPSEVEAAVKSCVEKAWYGRGYVLMPGCDIPDSVPLANLQTFLDAGRQCIAEAS